MRTVFHLCVSAALLALVSSPAFAGKKKIDSLIFQPAHASVAGCAQGPFLVLQEPDPFFKNFTRAKTHGIEQFRRGEEVVDKFPDELTVTVQFSQNAVPSLCPVIGLDPKSLKFRATWRDAGSTKVAAGTVVESELLDQGPWCEDKCGGMWKYELRINSEGVSLQDRLVINVDATDGTHIAEYVGTLGSSAERPTLVLLP